MACRKFDHQMMDAESNHPIYYINFASQNVLHTPPIPKSGWKSIETAFIEHSEQNLPFLNNARFFFF